MGGELGEEEEEEEEEEERVARNEGLQSEWESWTGGVCLKNRPDGV